MIPNQEEKEEIKARKEAKAMNKGDDDVSDNGSPSDKVVFEMVSPPQNAYQTPFTPRTQAFHALERKLPLRGD